MEAVNDVLELVQNVVFLLVTVWALVRWRRHRSTQARWLALTFLTLTVVIALGLITRGTDPELAPRWTAYVTISGLTLFPYLLLRFLDSVAGVPSRLRRGIELWTVVVLGTYLFGRSWVEGPGLMTYAWALAGLWLVTLGVVAVQFWFAGRGKPTLVRRRLRVLSVASAAIGTTLLLIVGLAVARVMEPTAVGPVDIAVQLVALAAAGSFLLGFAPPAAIRSWWRQPEERRLHQASVQLMASTTRQEVADLLVPHVRDVVAARGAALVHEGEVLATAGRHETHRELRGPGTTGATSYGLHDGCLLVWTNSYTPFFGEGELELLARLAVLADLALARATLLRSERHTLAELEAANAELESFVYSASHDLKSPLIAIQGYLDVLREQAGDVLDEECTWYVERMQSNAGYMEELVGDLLELSRVGRVDTEPEEVDLEALVDELGAEVAGLGAVSISRGELPTLWMNSLRVRQLLRNLFENAVSHGGRDDLHVRVEAHEPATVDGGVELRVRDDGVGIPEQYRDQVFGVFERLGAQESGSTGIGLAVCRKIVETVGGTIVVTDHEGGAEFAIHLPVNVLAGDTIDRRPGVPT